MRSLVRARARVIFFFSFFSLQFAIPIAGISISRRDACSVFPRTLACSLAFLLSLSLPLSGTDSPADGVSFGARAKRLLRRRILRARFTRRSSRAKIAVTSATAGDRCEPRLTHNGLASFPWLEFLATIRTRPTAIYRGAVGAPLLASHHCHEN